MAESQAGTPEHDYTGEARQQEVAPGEIVLGTLTGIDSDGRPLVDYTNNPAADPAVAISTANVTRQHLSRQVALLFAGGDLSKPVIVGFIHSPLYAMLESFDIHNGEEPSATNEQAKGTPADEGDAGIAHVDGERVVIEGKKEVVLKCGEASITLTRAGKILIRGKYLLNRSSGVNRILGGSVQVN